MTGGPRYWNEESQRWEEGEETAADAGTAPAAVVPPAGASSGPGGAVPDPGGARPGPVDAVPGPDGTGAVASPTAVGSGSDGSPTAVGPASGGSPAAGGAGPGAPSAADGGASAAWPPAGGSGPGAPPPVGEALPAAPVRPVPPDVSHSAPTLTGIQWPGAGPAPAQRPSPVPWSVPEPPHGPSHPPGVPVPAGADPRGAGRRRVWSVVGGATAVGVIAGLVLTLVLRDGEDPDGRADDKAASTSASQTPGPSAPGPQGPSTPGSPVERSPAEGAAPPSTPTGGLPAGHESYADPEGFTIARPTGWTRTTVPSKYGIDVVHYRSPDGERRLQVFEVSEATPGESHGLFLSDAVAKAPGFTELSLESLDDGDFTGSRLEYLVDSIEGEPDVGTWHVVDERFVAADGRLYAVAAYGAEADGREDERELLRTALGHFCPPYTTCGTDAGIG
ncbi:hypothetical protein SGRIM128S_03252 [Streptomyces griseomycini]|nr:hypothetical protein GCM10015536_19590 [Streptomyces griseomycini]